MIGFAEVEVDVDVAGTMLAFVLGLGLGARFPVLRLGINDCPEPT